MLSCYGIHIVQGEHLNTLISPGDEGGHGVGESYAREDPGHDGGGAEHSRSRRVPRLHGSARRIFVNIDICTLLQCGASGERLGFVELDLGCSTILLGK